MTKPLFIDVHILQTVPPSNINRDDTGSPKTARFGGVNRSRVSSQAWKKATRDHFLEYLDENELGVRTKNVIRLIAKKAQSYESSLSDEKALEASKEVFKKYCERGTNKLKFDSNDEYRLKTLFFTSSSEIDALARCVVGQEGMAELKKSEVKNPVDIAMFGRMIATAPDLNVDASVQVAHAIGIDRMQPEFDYFTALDDLAPKDNAGAAMIETTEFTSATLYRYANIDVLHLCENLGSTKITCLGIEAFLKSFIMSMPTGKQNSFANRTLPAAVMLQLRNTQPVSLVNAFEKPIKPTGGKSQVEIGCEKLAEQEKSIDNAFGTSPKKTFIVMASPDAMALSEALPEAITSNLETAVKGISDACASYLEEYGYSTERVG